MFELQIFLQRRRKLILRVAALLAVCVAGLLVVLPRANANDDGALAQSSGVSSILLSPARISGGQFSILYAPKLSSLQG